jgi:pimeloyl-ACP methyl ester carboxylesterase
MGLFGLVAGCASVADDYDSQEIESRGFSRTDTCFSVQVPGETVTHTVHGTLVSKGDFDRAVLFIHGGAGSRDAWAPANVLASRGYGVFTIDRLGYGESVYSGSGFALSVDAHVEITHQIVQEMRAGTYGCDGHATTAASGVFVAGQSLGGIIVELYATRYDDEVDGIISTGYSTFPPSATLIELFNFVFPQILAGDDYVQLLPYDDDGFSQQCADWMFYAPGAFPLVVDTICSQDAPGTIIDGLTPSGDLLSVLAAGPAIQAGTSNVEAPVLFVQADHDAINTGAAGGPTGTEPDLQAAEASYWSDTCNCEVSVTHSGTLAGHLWQFHYQALSLFGEVADWLDSH